MRNILCNCKLPTVCCLLPHSPLEGARWPVRWRGVFTNVHLPEYIGG